LLCAVCFCLIVSVCVFFFIFSVFTFSVFQFFLSPFLFFFSFFSRAFVLVCFFQIQKHDPTASKCAEGKCAAEPMGLAKAETD
jgi:hypothetical protein